MYQFAMNLKFLTKCGFCIALLYLNFVVFGFLGVIFLIFFISQCTVFMKMKKLAQIFNMYMKTLLKFCSVCRIQNIDFNKLMTLTDKAYMLNFCMLLFCIPLYRLEDLRRVFGKEYFDKDHTFNTFLSKLLIISGSYILSIVFLIIYSKILYVGYMKFVKKNSLLESKKQEIM